MGRIPRGIAAFIVCAAISINCNREPGERGEGRLPPESRKEQASAPETAPGPSSFLSPKDEVRRRLDNTVLTFYYDHSAPVTGLISMIGNEAVVSWRMQLGVEGDRQVEIIRGRYRASDVLRMLNAYGLAAECSEEGYLVVHPITDEQD